MFKMGCSMARKILTPGGSSSSSSSQQDQSLDHQAGSKKLIGSSNSNNKRINQVLQSEHPSQQQQQQQQQQQAGANKPRSGDELNDFSKLQEDPRLPLNVRQIFKITKSWKAIARTMSKTGTAMFLNLFEQNQDLFHLFERFQHLKGKQALHESMELREHAATVMSTLDHSINLLSNYDNFVGYLHSIGKLHRKVPGFKREHFWKIEQPFIKAIKQTLDERCNETIEEIYKIAIKLIIETIADGYGENADSPDAAADQTNDAGGRPGGNNNNNNDTNSNGGGGGTGNGNKSGSAPDGNGSGTGSGSGNGNKPQHKQAPANSSSSNGNSYSKSSSDAGASTNKQCFCQTAGASCLQGRSHLGQMQLDATDGACYATVITLNNNEANNNNINNTPACVLARKTPTICTGKRVATQNVHESNVELDSVRSSIDPVSKLLEAGKSVAGANCSKRLELINRAGEMIQSMERLIKQTDLKKTSADNFATCNKIAPSNNNYNNLIGESLRLALSQSAREFKQMSRGSKGAFDNTSSSADAPSATEITTEINDNNNNNDRQFEGIEQTEANSSNVDKCSSNYNNNDDNYKHDQQALVNEVQENLQNITISSSKLRLDSSVKVANSCSLSSTPVVEAKEASKLREFGDLVRNNFEAEQSLRGLRDELTLGVNGMKVTQTPVACNGSSLVNDDQMLLAASFNDKRRLHYQLPVVSCYGGLSRLESVNKRYQAQYRRNYNSPETKGLQRTPIRRDRKRDSDRDVVVVVVATTAAAAATAATTTNIAQIMPKELRNFLDRKRNNDTNNNNGHKPMKQSEWHNHGSEAICKRRVRLGMARRPNRYLARGCVMSRPLYNINNNNNTNNNDKRKQISLNRQVLSEEIGFILTSASMPKAAPQAKIAPEHMDIVTRQGLARHDRGGTFLERQVSEANKSPAKENLQHNNYLEDTKCASDDAKEQMKLRWHNSQQIDDRINSLSEAYERGKLAADKLLSSSNSTSIDNTPNKLDGDLSEFVQMLILINKLILSSLAHNPQNTQHLEGLSNTIGTTNEMVTS